VVDQEARSRQFPQVRKKARPNGVASLDASRADNLRHSKDYNTNLVNLEAGRQCGMVGWAPQNAAF